VKTCTVEGFEAIKVVCPGAHIETRSGIECVVIPTYDFDTGASGERVMQLIRRDPEQKFQPGDVLRHTKTGSPFNIVDPLRAFLKLRKGPKAGD